jgi:aldose 1-epimerase
VSSFAAERIADPESGQEVVVLRHRDPRGDGFSLQARVAPAAGGNLYSLSVGAEQLLEQPPSLAALSTSTAGTPLLFPCPNRVRDATFQFEGRRFSFPPNSGPNFIHGLVRRRPFQVVALASDPHRAAVAVALDWDPGQPEFASFPVVHRLTVTYTLRPGRLGIDYAVENQAAERLPFGFGVHPWFRVLGERAQVMMRVPVPARMDAEDRLPTGQTVPVAGTRFDLRYPTSLEGLDLDDVYPGARVDDPAWCEWRDRGLRLTLGASAAFTHVVVYTPPGRPVFCIENQTCSTDAHNLHARGLGRLAHLQIVEPGQTARGSLDWRIQWLPRRAPSPESYR